MSNEQALRTESQKPARIAAAIMFVLLVGTGYAISPSVESAVGSAPVAVAALTPTFVDAEQWTGDENLERWTAHEEVVQRFAGAEEHIQAF